MRRATVLVTLLLAVSALVTGFGPDADAATATLSFTELSAGLYHTCGETNARTIICWGDDSLGQSSVPAAPAGSAFLMVSAGYWHTCALTSLHSVRCWGADRDGESSGPSADPSGFTQVGAGDDFTCALTEAGIVRCWGLDNYGQSAPPPPPAGTTFTQVSAGGGFACAATADARVLCWGNTTVTMAQPITQVTSGGTDACGLTTSRAVFCWGTDTVHGQLDVPPGYTFTQLSAGRFHTCGLTTAGHAVCWGWNDGPDGAPAGQVSDTPAGEVFQQVSAGGYHTCGLTAAGLARCWGYDAEHQASPAPGPPTITSQPVGLARTIGDGFTLTVTATSAYDVGSQTVTLPQTYRWYHDGVPLAGATGSSYSVPAARLGDGGNYQVTVSNVFGTTGSRFVNVDVSYGVRPLYAIPRSVIRGQTIWLTLALVDSSGRDLSAPRIAVRARAVVPFDQPGDGGGVPVRWPMLYLPGLGSGGGYGILINTFPFDPGQYRLVIQVDGDPTLHSVPFTVAPWR